MCPKSVCRCQNWPRLALDIVDLSQLVFWFFYHLLIFDLHFFSTKKLLSIRSPVLSSASLMWLLLPTLFNPSLIDILLINSAKLSTFYTTWWTACFKGQNSKYLIIDITVFDYHTEYSYNEIFTTGMNRNNFKWKYD